MDFKVTREESGGISDSLANDLRLCKVDGTDQDFFFSGKGRSSLTGVERGIPGIPRLYGFEKEQLKKKRTVDDRVINVLNDTVPLKSFSAQNNHAKQCEELYSQLVKAYNSRDQSIRYCINTISQTVQSLREKKVATPDDFEVMKALRKEQTKLRLMQGELSVEEIIRDRTLKPNSGDEWVDGWAGELSMNGVGNITGHPTCQRSDVNSGLGVTI
ncbi:hypothetical protein FSP39_004504 [Pinctada imbricata]|uniref:Protein MIX23 n=1 Tax=Pinctada imbricata TaxID=66713 RepID=A0AA88Y2M3_PINIB|nr:hypothetical protein FSP39_004504 [Pinctada imbricata]